MPLDQTAKHYSQRRVLGIKAHYYDGLADEHSFVKVAATPAGMASLPALGLVFLVLYFEEEYRIAIDGEVKTRNYVRIIPEDVAIADRVWLAGKGDMGDHYRYGLIDDVPPSLRPDLLKLTTFVPDRMDPNTGKMRNRINDIWNSIQNDAVWIP